MAPDASPAATTAQVRALAEVLEQLGAVVRQLANGRGPDLAQQANDAHQRARNLHAQLVRAAERA